MIGKLAATATLLALSTAALADERKYEVVDTVPMELIRALIGTWYQIDKDGKPIKSLFTPGIKGCSVPLDGDQGGDLSVRQKAKSFEVATLGTWYKEAAVAPVAEPGLRGVKLGDMTIHALPPAPDGSPRIYITGGKSWDDEVLQKCGVG
jgi:hypothetical protein